MYSSLKLKNHPNNREMKPFIEVHPKSEASIHLNNLELQYLRLFAHNYTETEIGLLLDIDIQKLSILKLGVAEKLNEKDELRLMKKAFDYNLLNTIDYTPEFVEKEAHLYVNTFINILDPKFSHTSVDAIQNILVDFYKACKKIGAHRKQLSYGVRALNDLEKKYLLLKYNGFGEVSIINTLRLNASEIFPLKKDTLDRLRVNSLYNGYRQAITKGLIKKQRLETKLLVEASFRIAHDVYHLKSISYYTDKVRRQFIYNKLLDFYNSMHYPILFANMT